MKVNKLITWLSELQPDTEIYVSNIFNEWEQPIKHLRIATDKSFAEIIIDKE